MMLILDSAGSTFAEAPNQPIALLYYLDIWASPIHGSERYSDKLCYTEVYNDKFDL